MSKRIGKAAKDENPFMQLLKNSFGVKTLRLKATLGILLSAALLAGCGGGSGSSDGTDTSSSSLLSGTFVDSPVEGLEYETETQTGVTDADGTFMYMAGESVTFYVGDIMLGGGMAQSVMTPVDLVEGAVDESNPMVTNMARFLQTLDNDMNPENGILITQEMADAMIGHMVDFDMDTNAFEHSEEMQSVMDTINMMDSTGTMHTMVPIEEAQNHLANTMTGMGMMTGDAGMMGNDNLTSNQGGTVSTGSDLMSGTFVDSPVEGLEYETETQTGVTDTDGTFMYMPGETVTFYVGDIMLGGAMAQSVMTPVDLVDGAVDETNPAVTNMARFLQTMDQDMDAGNGITITQEVADAMIGHSLYFDMDVAAFESSEDMQSVMDTINMMDSSGTTHTMVTIEDARNHLADTMAGMTGDYSNMQTGSGMMN